MYFNLAEKKFCHLKTNLVPALVKSKCEIPSTEWKIPSTQWKIPSAEWKIPSGEWKNSIN